LQALCACRLFTLEDSSRLLFASISMGPAQANMRALSQKYELPLPFSNSTALIRLTSRETMTKTKNEQPKMPEKPSHLSAEQDTRNRSPDNTGPAIPTEQQPHEAATHTPTASDASGSYTTGNRSQETASSSPYLGGSLFAGPQDMLRDIFADAHHKIPSKSMAEYCTLSVVLTMVVYHILSYFIESRLTVATLLAFWLLVLTTHDPSEQHNILGAFPYFAGHGIAFMYENIHSGFIDRRSRRSPILSPAHNSLPTCHTASDKRHHDATSRARQHGQKTRPSSRRQVCARQSCVKHRDVFGRPVRPRQFRSCASQRGHEERP
jgi:hypothetical protein